MNSSIAFLPSFLAEMQVSSRGAKYIVTFELTNVVASIVGEFGSAPLEMRGKARQRSSGVTREIFDSFEEATRKRRLVGKQPSNIRSKDTAASCLGIVP